jgi:flagellar hook-associated protein 3 FlgL
VYDPDAKTVQIRIDAGNTTAAQVISALNNDAAFAADYSVAADASELTKGATPGGGLVQVATTAVTFDGSGAELDQDSGIQIVNGGKTFTVSFTNATTIEDVLNSINGLNAVGASVKAELNADGTGINIRSTKSGSDFSIGENGGTTATQLGIRSLTQNTKLADLNYGAGIGTRAGTDFIVRRADGVELAIDVSGAVTVGDVLDAVNNHAQNQDGANRVVAKLNTYGNGIEFVSSNPSTSANFAILPTNQSPAAISLGIVSPVHGTSLPAVNIDPASVRLSLAGTSTDLRLVANTAGPQLNGVDVIFVNDGSVTGNNATVAFDSGAGTLTVFIDSTAGSGTTAETIRQAINANGNFQAELDTTDDPTNDGSGVVTDLGTIGTTAGGTARISGQEVNPGEVRGIFSALVRLRSALLTGDAAQTSRSVDMLDEGLSALNFSRAEIGARQKSLESLQTRLALEEIDLREALSNDIDVDLAQAISDLTARQISLQASLQLTGSISRLTLLDYL